VEKYIKNAKKRDMNNIVLKRLL